MPVAKCCKRSPDASLSKGDPQPTGCIGSRCSKQASPVNRKKKRLPNRKLTFGELPPQFGQSGKGGFPPGRPSRFPQFSHLNAHIPDKNHPPPAPPEKRSCCSSPCRSKRSSCCSSPTTPKSSARQSQSGTRRSCCSSKTETPRSSRGQSPKHFHPYRPLWTKFLSQDELQEAELPNASAWRTSPGGPPEARCRPCRPLKSILKLCSNDSKSIQTTPRSSICKSTSPSKSGSWCPFPCAQTQSQDAQTSPQFWVYDPTTSRIIPMGSPAELSQRTSPCGFQLPSCPVNAFQLPSKPVDSSIDETKPRRHPSPYAAALERVNARMTPKPSPPSRCKSPCKIRMSCSSQTQTQKDSQENPQIPTRQNLQQFPNPQMSANRNPQQFPNPQMSANQNPQQFPNPLMSAHQNVQQLPPPQVSANQNPQQFPNSQMSANQNQFPNPQMSANQNLQQFPNPQMSAHQNLQQFPNPQMSAHQNLHQFSNPQISAHQNLQQFPNPQVSANQNPQQFQNPHLSAHQNMQQFPDPQRPIHPNVQQFPDPQISTYQNLQLFPHPQISAQNNSQPSPPKARTIPISNAQKPATIPIPNSRRSPTDLSSYVQSPSRSASLPPSSCFPLARCTSPSKTVTQNSALAQTQKNSHPSPHISVGPVICSTIGTISPPDTPRPSPRQGNSPPRTAKGCFPSVRVQKDPSPSPRISMVNGRHYREIPVISQSGRPYRDIPVVSPSESPPLSPRRCQSPKKFGTSCFPFARSPKHPHPSPPIKVRYPQKPHSIRRSPELSSATTSSSSQSMRTKKSKELSKSRSCFRSAQTPTSASPSPLSQPTNPSQELSRSRSCFHSAQSPTSVSPSPPPPLISITNGDKSWQYKIHSPSVSPRVSPRMSPRISPRMSPRIAPRMSPRISSSITRLPTISVSPRASPQASSQSSRRSSPCCSPVDQTIPVTRQSRMTTILPEMIEVPIRSFSSWFSNARPMITASRPNHEVQHAKPGRVRRFWESLWNRSTCQGPSCKGGLLDLASPRGLANLPYVKDERWIQCPDVRAFAIFGFNVGIVLFLTFLVDLLHEKLEPKAPELPTNTIVTALDYGQTTCDILCDQSQPRSCHICPQQTPADPKPSLCNLYIYE